MFSGHLTPDAPKRGTQHEKPELVNILQLFRIRNNSYFSPIPLPLALRRVFLNRELLATDFAPKLNRAGTVSEQMTFVTAFL